MNKLEKTCETLAELDERIAEAKECYSQHKRGLNLYLMVVLSTKKPYTKRLRT